MSARPVSSPDISNRPEGQFAGLERLVVPESMSAQQAIRAAVTMEADYIVTVNEIGEAVGIQFLATLEERLPRARLAQGIFASIPGGEDQLVHLVEALETAMPEFHSETLNLSAPDPIICQGFGKPHAIAPPGPCRLHPGAGNQAVTINP